MRYRLHSAAVDEHLEHIAFYEAQREGLGRRYDEAFEASMRAICESPQRFKLVAEPDIRRAILRGFPYFVLYREVKGIVEVLAVAHHRRRPNYWHRRVDKD